jgi:SHS2 domain-containing protein
LFELSTNMYETFDHTADVGIRARAESLSSLFEEAARGLFAVILVNPGAARPIEETSVSVEGTEPEDLLHDWLAELLYVFDTERLVPAEFKLRLTDTGLSATLLGEPLDPARHTVDAEVKAITYHGLTVRQEEGGWLAEVIVDL